MMKIVRVAVEAATAAKVVATAEAAIAVVQWQQQ